MKSLLKYILLGLVALLFVNSAKEFFSSAEEVSAADCVEMQAEYSVQSFNLFSNHPDVCASLQISSVGSMFRLQNSSARKQVNNSRQGYEYLKSGKIVNLDTWLTVQRKSLICNSSLVEPACILSMFCRFII